MRSTSDGHVAFRPLVPQDPPTSPVARSRPDPRPGDEPERGCQVTIRLDLDAPEPVVSVAGTLERPGGALLAAVLEYVRQTHGGPIAVDLSRVSRIDGHGLAPVIESGVVVDGASPRVHRALTGLMGSSLPEGRRQEPPDRLPASGNPIRNEAPGVPRRHTPSPRRPEGIF